MCRQMEKLTIGKLMEVKKFAENLGFNGYVRSTGEYAYFEIGLPSARITIYYEVAPMGQRRNISIGWTSCDGGSVSIPQANDFIKFMGYAVSIAEKLKE